MTPIDQESNKLKAGNFVDWSSVCEKRKVRDEAQTNNEVCHSGALITLCHEKHAELVRPEEKKEYKGRIVFRGDDVRDAVGYLAVFSEQGTSAPHLEVAKMMDALARLSVDPDDESSQEGE